MAQLDSFNNLFLASLQADNNIRQQAESQLTALLEVQKENQVVAQAVSIYFKNKVNKCWDPSNTKELISPEDQQYVRDNLLRVASVVPRSTLAPLIASLDSIIPIDLEESRWPNFLPLCLALVQSEGASETYAGLAALYEFVKAHRWGSSEKRARLIGLVDTGFPYLLQKASLLLPQTSYHAGVLMHLILKCYYSTIRLELPPQLMQQSTLLPWGTLFMQNNEKLIEASYEGMPEASSEKETHPWWKSKKWALKCLNILFSRYGRAPSEVEYKQFAHGFLNSYAPTIMGSYISQLQGNTRGVWMSAKVKQLIAQFLSESVRAKVTWLVLKPYLQGIIADFIYPDLCFNAELEEVFECDPQEFIRQEYVRRRQDMAEEFRFSSGSCGQLLFDISKHRFKQTFKGILQFISNAIAENRACADTSQAYRMYGAMKMFDVLSALAVRPSSPIKDQIEAFMTHNIMPQLVSEHAYLRANACDLLLQYEEYECGFSPAFQLAAFQGILNNLVYDDLVVKVAAAMALRPFFEVEAVQAAVIQNIKPILEALMNLTRDTDIDSILQTVETMVSQFAEHLAPFALELGSQLRLAASRPMLELHLDLDDYNDADDERVASIQSTLRTMSTLALAMEASSEILGKLEEEWCDLLGTIFVKEITELYQETFDIMETTIYCRKIVSPSMWKLFPVVHKVICISDGAPFIDEAATILDNYISYGSAVLVQNPEMIQKLVEIVSVVMNPVTEFMSGGSLVKGCEIIESLLLHLRGHIDSVVPAFLGMMVAHMKDLPKRKPAFRVHIFSIFINCLYYNPGLTLAYTDAHSLTEQLLSFWTSSPGLFVRVHDKKLCVLALLSYASLRGPLPAEASQLLLKLVGTMPEAAKAREEQVRQHEADEDDESDDDSDELEPVEGDEDVITEDDKYMAALAGKAQERSLALQNGEFEDEYEDDSSEGEEDWDVEDLEEDIFFETPLDQINIYAVFLQTLQTGAMYNHMAQCCTKEAVDQVIASANTLQHQKVKTVKL